MLFGYEVISPWTIYWITRLDELRMLLEVPAFLGIFFGIIGVIFLVIAKHLLVNDDDDEVAVTILGAKKLILATLIVGVACTCVRCFLPSSKEMAAIIVIPAIANNEAAQDEAGELYRLTKAWLEKQTGVPTPDKE